MGESIYSKGARFCKQYTDCKECPIHQGDGVGASMCVLVQIKNPMNDADRSRIKHIQEWARKNPPNKREV